MNERQLLIKRWLREIELDEEAQERPHFLSAYFQEKKRKVESGRAERRLVAWAGRGGRPERGASSLRAS